MSAEILTLRIGGERDVVVARRRARQIAGLLDFSPQDQVRIATGVSEIARNALDYAGGGKVEFLAGGSPPAQHLLVRISDRGPGIRELDAILAGRYRSRTGLGIGITGTRSLMDSFAIDTRLGDGTTVSFAKEMDRGAPRVGPEVIARVAEELVRRRADDPVLEIQEQNQELLRAMEELREREEEGARLYQEAQEAARARDGVLAIVSHDLRNPLDAVLMSASFLLDVGSEDLDAELLEKQLRVIQRAARRANRLISDLLDVARVESGRLSVETAPRDVASLLADAVEALRHAAEEKGVRLEQRVGARLPPACVDGDRVLQALTNLGGNAIKFTPEGGSVVLAAEPGDGEVRFQVRDTGVGIPPDQIEHIFDRFWQARHADRRGVGLGLAIVRGIVEAHGGRLWAESEPGAGSTFTFTVPAAGSGSPQAEVPLLQP